MIIDPRGLNLRQWVNGMAFLLNGNPATMKLLKEDDWRVWAREVIRARAPQAPDPEQFRNWRDWAQRFNATIEFTG